MKTLINFVQILSYIWTKSFKGKTTKTPEGHKFVNISNLKSIGVSISVDIGLVFTWYWIDTKKDNISQL